MLLTEPKVEDIESIEYNVKVNIPFFNFMCTQIIFPPPPFSCSEPIATTQILRILSLEKFDSE